METRYFRHRTNQDLQILTLNGNPTFFRNNFLKNVNKGNKVTKSMTQQSSVSTLVSNYRFILARNSKTIQNSVMQKYPCLQHSFQYLQCIKFVLFKYVYLKKIFFFPKGNLNPIFNL